MSCFFFFSSPLVLVVVVCCVNTNRRIIVIFLKREMDGFIIILSYYFCHYYYYYYYYHLLCGLFVCVFFYDNSCIDTIYIKKMKSHFKNFLFFLYCLFNVCVKFKKSFMFWNLKAKKTIFVFFSIIIKYFFLFLSFVDFFRMFRILIKLYIIYNY